MRELEERGIGRPSTYAEIISKVQARDYVEKMDGTRFRPTTLGKFVVDGLVKSELDFMDPTFTSKMEEELDEVESGKEERVDLLNRFYKRFRSQLDKSKKLSRWNPEPVPTDEKCEIDGGPASDAQSAGPRTAAGSSAARTTPCARTRAISGRTASRAPCARPASSATSAASPWSSAAAVTESSSACRGYPTCKNARPVPLGVKCPKCGGDLIEIRPKKRGGKTFYGCQNYQNESIKCDFKSWQKPNPEPCPSGGAPILVYGGTRVKPMIACANKECGSTSGRWSDLRRRRLRLPSSRATPSPSRVSDLATGEGEPLGHGGPAVAIGTAHHATCVRFRVVGSDTELTGVRSERHGPDTGFVFVRSVVAGPDTGFLCPLRRCGTGHRLCICPLRRHGTGHRLRVCPLRRPGTGHRLRPRASPRPGTGPSRQALPRRPRNADNAPKGRTSG